jgi:hypothetical protein
MAEESEPSSAAPGMALHESHIPPLSVFPPSSCPSTYKTSDVVEALSSSEALVNGQVTETTADPKVETTDDDAEQAAEGGEQARPPGQDSPLTMDSSVSTDYTAPARAEQDSCHGRNTRYVSSDL